LINIKDNRRKSRKKSLWSNKIAPPAYRGKIGDFGGWMGADAAKNITEIYKRSTRFAFLISSTDPEISASFS
jgi:hypothetical protein